MIHGSCHCGAVRVALTEAPESVTSCNCSLCIRYGALWAYFAPAKVRVEGPTSVYLHGDKELEFHRCARCGCVTHWAAVAPNAQRMAVNARLLAPELVAATRVRHFDGRESWTYLCEG